MSSSFDGDDDDQRKLSTTALCPGSTAQLYMKYKGLFSLHNFVHLMWFWTQLKLVHLLGPCSLRLCSLRPCSSRPFCNSKQHFFCLATHRTTTVIVKAKSLQSFLDFTMKVCSALVVWRWHGHLASCNSQLTT